MIYSDEAKDVAFAVGICYTAAACLGSGVPALRPCWPVCPYYERVWWFVRAFGNDIDWNPIDTNKLCRTVCSHHLRNASTTAGTSSSISHKSFAYTTCDSATVFRIFVSFFETKTAGKYVWKCTCIKKALFCKILLLRFWTFPTV